MLFLLNSLIREINERGVLEKFVPPRPVLSVGNIRFGGTGKTPHVIYLADYLVKRGKKVCVLSRGYKRKSKKLLIFKTGETPDIVESVGDEPMLIKRRVPEIILCVGANRREGMEKVLGETHVDLFLLDDGFQQFNMKKSLDMVLLRYEDLPGLSSTLNHFRMRESPRSLTYADLIVITKVPKEIGALSIPSGGTQYFNSVERAYSRYRIRELRSNRGVLIDDSRDKEFFLFAGLADFSGLLATARDHGIRISGYAHFPDHAEYAPRDIDRIRQESLGRPLLTSEKDLVKLPYGKFGEIFSISIDVELVQGKELFEKKVLDIAGLV